MFIIARTIECSADIITVRELQREETLSTLQRLRAKQCRAFFPHSCRLIESALGGCKKKQRIPLDTPCAFFLPFSMHNLSMNVPGLLARATRHRHAEFLVSDERYVRVCTRGYVYMYSCIRVWVACRFFFPLPQPRNITLHGRDAFSNRWWPTTALFFPSLTPSRVCFPRFFRFFTGAPIIRLSAFASVSYSFSTDRGRPLSLTTLPPPLVSTLFHLIKGHKLPARPPYDDGGKKRGREKKRTVRKLLVSLFPRGFPRRRTLSGMKS